MTIGEALRDHLLGDAQIAALVGTQIFPVMLPEGVLKAAGDTSGAITYATISAIRFAHLRGQGALARPRVQIDSWARSLDRAVALGALVRRRLEGYSGDWTDDESPATTVHVKILFDTEQELAEPEIHGGLGRHLGEYLIFHGTAGGVL